MPTLIEAIFDRIILPLNLIATTVVFYVATRIYLFPHLARLQPRSVLIPILLLHSLRHLGMMFLSDLPRFSTAVRLSGGFGRFACCRAGFCLSLFCPSKFGPCATYGMGFQCLGHARFTRCHYSRDGLRSPCIYGPLLLDSRVLGARSVDYPLHNVRYSYQYWRDQT